MSNVRAPSESRPNGPEPNSTQYCCRYSGSDGGRAWDDAWACAPPDDGRDVSPAGEPGVGHVALLRRSLKTTLIVLINLP